MIACLALRALPCATRVSSGVGTFGFELSTAQWNGAAVAVRTTLTELFFDKTADGKYRARYQVDVPAADYRAALEAAVEAFPLSRDDAAALEPHRCRRHRPVWR